MEGPDAAKWKTAAEKEITQIMAHETWQVTELPAGAKPIGCKWVFRIKSDGTYKARLVAMGFTQKAGIDFQATFSPVMNLKSLRLLLSLAAALDLDTLQMDVDNAYLNELNV